MIADAPSLQRVEHEVARILAETERPVEVYAATLEVIGRSLGWGLGAAWEVGPDDERLRCVCTWHVGSGAPEFEALSGRLTLESGGAVRRPAARGGGGAGERVAVAGNARVGARRGRVHGPSRPRDRVEPRC